MYSKPRSAERSLRPCSGHHYLSPAARSQLAETPSSTTAVFAVRAVVRREDGKWKTPNGAKAGTVAQSASNACDTTAESLPSDSA